MGEALDQAKKKLGLGNNKPGGESGNKKEGDITLDEAINQVDNIEAREVVRAKAREMKAQYELRAREAENRLREIGGEKVGNEEEAKLRDQISTTATMLLEKNVDPKIVGQYILGSTPVTPITVSGGMPTQQGFSFDDVKKIWDMATENKGSGELKGVLENLTTLTAEVKALKDSNRHDPLDPITFAKQQAEQTRAYYETLKSLGMIKESESSTYEGEPLEVVKEKHRHEEKIEEIHTDREYKQEVTKIAGDIPERIGRGIAGQFGEEGEGKGSSGGGLEYITCQEEGCGQKIYITPDTGPQVTCPKCGSIYTRKEPVETKEE